MMGIFIKSTPKFPKIDQKYWKILQNLPKILENPSNNRKIWSEKTKTVYCDILLQEQYGR